jgi:hypothetical protein
VNARILIQALLTKEAENLEWKQHDFLLLANKIVFDKA